MRQAIELTDFHRGGKITIMLDKVESFRAEDEATVIRMVSGNEHKVEEGIDLVSEIVVEN